MFSASRVVIDNVQIVSAQNKSESISALLIEEFAVPLYGAWAGTGTETRITPEGIQTHAHILGKSGVTNTSVDQPRDVTGKEAATIILSKIDTCRRVGVMNGLGERLLQIAEKKAKAVLEAVEA